MDPAAVNDDETRLPIIDFVITIPQSPVVD